MKLDKFSSIEIGYIGIFYFIGTIFYVVVGLAGAGIILGWNEARSHYFKT